jgi:hypothetical protein
VKISEDISYLPQVEQLLGLGYACPNVKAVQILSAVRIDMGAVELPTTTWESSCDWLRSVGHLQLFGIFLVDPVTFSPNLNFEGFGAHKVIISISLGNTLAIVMAALAHSSAMTSALRCLSLSGLGFGEQKVPDASKDVLQKLVASCVQLDRLVIDVSMFASTFNGPPPVPFYHFPFCSHITHDRSTREPFIA